MTVSYHVRRSPVHESLMEKADFICGGESESGKIDRAFFDMTLENRTVEAMARSIETTMRVDLHYSRINPTRLMESLMEQVEQEESFTLKEKLAGSLAMLLVIGALAFLLVAILWAAWMAWGWLA